MTAPDRTTDPVDIARHYWHHHGLDGDEQRFLALTSLLRYQRIVVDSVEAELKAHGLNMTDYLFLMTLHLSSDGTRLISGLARSLLVHPTTATLATDRLERRSLLTRSPHPTDRRATCVTISDLGRDTVDSATRSLTLVGFGMRGSESENVIRFSESLTAMRQSAGDA